MFVFETTPYTVHRYDDVQVQSINNYRVSEKANRLNGTDPEKSDCTLFSIF